MIDTYSGIVLLCLVYLAALGIALFIHERKRR